LQQSLGQAIGLVVDVVIVQLFSIQLFVADSFLSSDCISRGFFDCDKSKSTQFPATNKSPGLDISRIVGINSGILVLAFLQMDLQALCCSSYFLAKLRSCWVLLKGTQIKAGHLLVHLILQKPKLQHLAFPSPNPDQPASVALIFVVFSLARSSLSTQQVLLQIVLGISLQMM
jgi:hypothetical protein